MKRLLCILCAVLSVLSTLSIYISAQDEIYEDVPEGIWYSQFVADCAEKGLMIGTSDTTFSPDIEMTRAMFVQTLYNYYKTYIKGTDKDLNSDDLESTVLPFTDIESSAYYIEALKWATNIKLASGVSPTEFAPDAPVTREQMAVFLDRFINYFHYYYILVCMYGGEYFYYSDKSEISDYALQSVVNVTKGDLMSGSDSCFRPKEPAKRCEVATVFSRMESLISGVELVINRIDFSGDREYILTDNEGKYTSLSFDEGYSGDMRIYREGCMDGGPNWAWVYVDDSISYTFEREYAEGLYFSIGGSGYQMSYRGSGKKITFRKGQEVEVYGCNNEEFKLTFIGEPAIDITGKSTSEITSGFKDGQVTINGLDGVGKVAKRDIFTNQILFETEIKNGEPVTVQ